jgi:putative molybdopterin biosynthesis protein
MARYLRVVEDIASQIEAGTLAPGEELPSVREAAAQYKTTASTVGHAYQHLADAGVIMVADRQRSRVAADGLPAARRLLGVGCALRLAGSDDPGLDLVLRHTGQAVATVGARGSFHGLTRVWRGQADAAAIHLRHRSGVYNVPFARGLLRGQRAAMIHLWRREQGLLTPPGNPGHVRGPADLPGLRVAMRPFGAGTRVLLDQLLAQVGVSPSELSGPEAGSHLEVALAIASGQVDAGLGVRAAATALDLDFVPVTWEDFDIVLSADDAAAAEPLISALRESAVQSSLGNLGGYDLAKTGAVQFLS